jgi:hypothetical protein
MMSLIGVVIVFLAGAIVENKFPFVTKNLKKIGL